jgi:hypothetical protein
MDLNVRFLFEPLLVLVYVGCSSAFTMLLAMLLCTHPIVLGSHFFETTEDPAITSLLMEDSIPGNVSVENNVPWGRNLTLLPLLDVVPEANSATAVARTGVSMMQSLFIRCTRSCQSGAL